MCGCWQARICWQRDDLVAEFDEPIVLPDGSKLVTLLDAGDYIIALPKKEPQGCNLGADRSGLDCRICSAGRMSGCGLVMAHRWTYSRYPSAAADG